MQTLWQDLRYSFRTLRQKPGFTAAVVLTLALGIGANATIFSVINTFLLRRLPVAEPDRLTRLFTHNRQDGRFRELSYPNFLDYRNQNTTLSGLLGYKFMRVGLSRGDQTELAYGELVTGNYFDLLGVKAAQGRTFLPEEDRTPGTHPVVVIGDQLWRFQFGADPKVVGTTVKLNGRSCTVVGIAPPGFIGVKFGLAADLWVPMMMKDVVMPDRGLLENRGADWLEVMGRLKAGATLSQAQAEMTTIAKRLEQTYPTTNKGDALAILPERDGRLHPDEPSRIKLSAGLLMIVVGLVLLIACANVANLLLARGTERRKEIAIRLALGATRGRLLRLLLTESSLLSLLGGAMGLLLAWWGARLVPAFLPPLPFKVGLDFIPDARVLGFTLLISLLTGVVFGLAPAWQASKPDLDAALKGDGVVPTTGRRWMTLRNLLVVSQVAVSLVLLVVAGLFVRSLMNAQTVDIGFEPRNVVLMSFDQGLRGYTVEQGRLLQEQLRERVKALPGVAAATFADNIPLGGNHNRKEVLTEGQDLRPESRGRRIGYIVAGLDYFDTLGIPLLRGRDFTEQDRAGAPRVVILNENAARTLWPGQDPIGQRVKFSVNPQSPSYEVVGVAKDGKYERLGEAALPFMYLPLLQNYTNEVILHTRTASAPNAITAAIRKEAQALDRDLPVYGIQTMNEYLRLALFPARIGATLLGIFGLLALLLASVGLCGVMMYAVSQRTREIGIRMALGARPGDIFKQVIRQGVGLTAVGAAIGLVIALALTRVLAGVLYGVSATDPMIFGLILLLLAVVALIACFIPARRATKVDPMVALRYE